MMHDYYLTVLSTTQSGVDASRKRTRDDTMMVGEGTQSLARTEVSDGCEQCYSRGIITYTGS